MERKNFRRLNEQSCLDCDHSYYEKKDNKNFCGLDGLPIGDSERSSQMRCEFVCDCYRVMDWDDPEAIKRKIR